MGVPRDMPWEGLWSQYLRSKNRTRRSSSKSLTTLLFLLGVQPPKGSQCCRQKESSTLPSHTPPLRNNNKTKTEGHMMWAVMFRRVCH